MIKTINITDAIKIGPGQPLTLLAGPCVIEEMEICEEICSIVKAICDKLGINYVFKASFDKANRTSINSYRGPGIEKGLETLAALKEKFNVPIVTDIHESWQAEPVGKVVDIIQIPAFLCRQTDLLMAAAKTGKVVNVKKGQFIAPGGMTQVINKLEESGCEKITLTERGYTFGYGNMVVDMRALAIMRALGQPVIFDATHSVQLPGGQGSCSGGERQFIAPLARAAAGVGIDGLFTEVHPNPEKALCDGPNSLPLSDVEALLTTLVKIDELSRDK